MANGRLSTRWRRVRANDAGPHCGGVPVGPHDRRTIGRDRSPTSHTHDRTELGWGVAVAHGPRLRDLLDARCTRRQRSAAYRDPKRDEPEATGVRDARLLYRSLGMDTTQLVGPVGAAG